MLTFEDIYEFKSAVASIRSKFSSYENILLSFPAVKIAQHIPAYLSKLWNTISMNLLFEAFISQMKLHLVFYNDDLSKLFLTFKYHFHYASINYSALLLHALAKCQMHLLVHMFWVTNFCQEIGNFCLPLSTQMLMDNPNPYIVT